MKLIKEMFDDVKYLTESTEDGKKNLYIQGTFLVGEQINRNNRMYKMDTLRKEVNRYNEELVKTNRALGELGHPDSPSINLERVSHKIVSLKEDGNSYFGKALVLDTPYGKIVKNFIENNVNLGVSSRALGSLSMTKEGYNLVQDDLRLATAADVVADPSAPGAFVDGLMEQKDWMFIDGKFEEMEMEQARKRIIKASSRQIEEVALMIFEKYLQKL